MHRPVAHKYELKLVYSDLYKIYNLVSAWKKVRKKKACPGIDGVSVMEFEMNLDKNLRQIGRKLRKDKYSFDPIINLTIKTKKGKDRVISLLTVADKIVQHAVLKIIEPVVDRHLSSSCFGFRKGIGIENAVKAVTNARRNDYCYGVKADISNFFDSLDHNLLEKIIMRVIGEPRLCKLIFGSFRVRISNGKGGVIKKTKGVPQGAILSPLLSNLYMIPFDRTFCDRKYRFVRYSDDFLVLCRSPDEVSGALHIVRRKVSRMKLTLKGHSIRFFSFKRGFRFLGHYFRENTIKLTH